MNIGLTGYSSRQPLCYAMALWCRGRDVMSPAQRCADVTAKMAAVLPTCMGRWLIEVIEWARDWPLTAVQSSARWRQYDVVALTYWRRPDGGTKRSSELWRTTMTAGAWGYSPRATRLAQSGKNGEREERGSGCGQRFLRPPPRLYAHRNLLSIATKGWINVACIAKTTVLQKTCKNTVTALKLGEIGGEWLRQQKVV